MKGRESGMPSETYWETFFNVETTLDILTGSSIEGNVLEFGCGYGSFTLPVAEEPLVMLPRWILTRKWLIVCSANLPLIISLMCLQTSETLLH